MKIMGMCLEMFGDFINSLRQHGNLDLGGPGIAVTELEFRNDTLLPISVQYRLLNCPK